MYKALHNNGCATMDDSNSLFRIQALGHIHTHSGNRAYNQYTHNPVLYLPRLPAHYLWDNPPEFVQSRQAIYLHQYTATDFLMKKTCTSGRSAIHNTAVN